MNSTEVYFYYFVTPVTSTIAGPNVIGYKDPSSNIITYGGPIEVIIYAYKSCDSSNYLAFAQYTDNSSQNASSSKPYRICHSQNTLPTPNNPNAPKLNIIINWNGLSIDNPNYFTVTINDQKTTLLYTSSKIFNCSSLPHPNYTPCPSIPTVPSIPSIPIGASGQAASSIPIGASGQAASSIIVAPTNQTNTVNNSTVTGQSFEFVPTIDATGPPAVVISGYKACDTGRPAAAATYITGTGINISVTPAISLCPGNNTINSNIIITWDGTTINNADGFTVRVNGNTWVNTTQNLFGLSNTAPCSSLPNNGKEPTCTISPISPSGSTGSTPSPIVPTTITPPSSSSSNRLPTILIIVAVIIVLIIVGFIAYYFLKRA